MCRPYYRPLIYIGSPGPHWEAQLCLRFREEFFRALTFMLRSWASVFDPSLNLDPLSLNSLATKSTRSCVILEVNWVLPRYKRSSQLLARSAPRLVDLKYCRMLGAGRNKGRPSAGIGCTVWLTLSRWSRSVQRAKKVKKDLTYALCCFLLLGLWRIGFSYVGQIRSGVIKAQRMPSTSNNRNM